MVAAVVACLGVVLSWYLGTTVLGWSDVSVFLGIVASNFAGMVALLSTLNLEKTRWIRTHVLRGSLQTWGLFLTLYFGLLLGLTPGLREMHPFLVEIFPLIMTTGFTILIFGPIQDRLVAADQRRQRLRMGTSR